jgi:hypothetical protein
MSHLSMWAQSVSARPRAGPQAIARRVAPCGASGAALITTKDQFGNRLHLRSVVREEGRDSRPRVEVRHLSGTQGKFSRA